MNEKLMMTKDKVVDSVKKVVEYFKSNMMSTAARGFAVVSLILILVAIFALQEYVISVCVLIILEAAMAALLHKVELWKHGVMLAAQFVAALIIKRIPLVIICILAYVAATVALQFMTKKESQS